MAIEVNAFDDATVVLSVAGEFLAGEPVHHNLVLTLLHRCVATGDAGRFWTVEDDGTVVGVVFQSPLHFFATLTPMATPAAAAAADAIADQGVALPGVNGEAATAAAFAGQWTERVRVGATPAEGLRLYEAARVTDPREPGGVGRPMVAAERDLALRWYEEFEREALPAPNRDIATAVDRRLAAGELWLWEHDGAVCFLGMSTPVAGAVRIGPVYTPPAARRCGYASALVGKVSADARAAGLRCLLYTDLANPGSNSVYRALGYRAVAEITRYEFDRAG